MRQPEAGAEEGGSVSQRKARDQWAVGLEAPGWGWRASSLDGTCLCVVFYPVLFCTLTFPVVCFLPLHLGTKVGVWLRVSLPVTSAPHTDSTPCSEMVP